MESGNDTPEPSSTVLCGNGPSESSCFAADDFTVPPGPPWYVEVVHVDGRGGTGDVFSWEALQSDGPPAAEELNLGPFEFHFGSTVLAGGGSETALPGADDFDIGSTGGFQGAALTPGHYWLSVYATPPFTKPPVRTPSTWEWQTQSPANGSPALWSAPQCAEGFYQLLAGCGQPGPDLRFRLEGQLLDKSFNSLKIGKKLQTPDGGVNIAATLAGIPDQHGLMIEKIGGKGAIARPIVKYDWSFKHGLPAQPTSAYAGGNLPVIIKVRPGPKLAEALRNGKEVKLHLLASYTRAINSSEPISIPSGSRKFSVVLKKN
jgi:hypothetical protein